MYADSCAPCHGIDATGDGPLAASLKTPPPDLTGLAPRTGGVFPRDFVIQTITGEMPVAAHGPRAMPVWSQRFEPSGSGATAAAAIYARQRLELLATYIQSLQRPARP